MRKILLTNRQIQVIASLIKLPLIFLTATIPAKSRPNGISRRALRVSPKILKASSLDTNGVLEQMESTIFGLEEAEVERRLEEYGYNDVAREKRLPIASRLLGIVKNPLILLLSILALVSYLIQDISAVIVIASLLFVSIFLRFFQEMSADRAAEKLKAMVSTTATVLRINEKKEIPLRDLVPGDIILLSAGDMVPADVRLISAKDLFVNQAALTGESLPVEKSAGVPEKKSDNPLEISNICYLGSNIESGTATAVVIATGKDTFLGSLASRLTAERAPTSFDRGVNSFTWLMIRFMGVMVPLVFILNGTTKGNWSEALLFALAVAVGLTPEMLPMIVTVNLSRGAISMSRRQVIVKHLGSIQNFGAMDILCTDKTGTITEGRVVLEKHLDIVGKERDEILEYAYLNSYYQSGLRSLMDAAILSHVELERQLIWKERHRKVDEIPFDFARRRMSVVVQDNSGNHILICKGATEGLIRLCQSVDLDGQIYPLNDSHVESLKRLEESLSNQGFRVITLAYKIIPVDLHGSVYTVADEKELVLMGILAFLDPPKQTAPEALQKLTEHNVSVKILTGDSEAVTRSICQRVGIPAQNILLGSDIENMPEEDLAEAAEKTSVFARLSPAHKERIVRALQKKGHVIGFLGDGINDAPALKAADVGISVNSAVDIARESSDIILLETSLLVLESGIMEGRRVFGNITKYIRMAASSNFGNMLSVVGASIFLPFLPMLPIQILINNMLYDFSQTAIPTDRVDSDWLQKPRKWSINNLFRFIMIIGPISSIFDYTTFLVLLYAFNCWQNPDLFHTGWFVESLFTQSLIIHVIRTRRIPFIQSRASLPLILSSITVVIIGALLPFSPFAETLGFVSLPPLYWVYLAGALLCYILVTQRVKTWFFRHFGE